MAHVNDNGVEIWYNVTGPSEGNGEPVVLTGGWGLIHDQFHAVRPLLADKLQLIDWNYRGTGHSTRELSEPLTMDRMVEDLRLVLHKLELNEVHLWGTSTGATISTAFAIAYPEKVKTLTTFPAFAYTEASRKKSNTYVNLVRDFGYVALAKFTQWIGCGDKNIYGPKGDEIAKFEAGAFTRNFDVDELPGIIDAIYATDLTEQLHVLKMPILMLLGSSGENGADHAKIRAGLNTFIEHCPQTETKIMDGVGGTYMLIEDPEGTVPLFMEWIEEHS